MIYQKAKGKNMKTYQVICVLLIIAVASLGIAACDLSEDKRNNFTSPGSMQEDGGSLMNFSSDPDEGNKFGVYKKYGLFKVRVKPGSYRLKYTTKLGTFYIVFHANDIAMLSLGLTLGDDVWEASLESGVIVDGVQPVVDDGLVAVYAMPGTGTQVVWGDVLTLDGVLSLTLISQGFIVVGDDVVSLGGTTESSQFGIYVGDGNFQVYVPAGEYLLEYTTTVGTFQIVFRANFGEFLTVDLLHDDELLDVSIQQGNINFSAVPVSVFGGISVFRWPTSAITVVNIFVININISPLVIVQDGIIVISPIIIIFDTPEVIIIGDDDDDDDDDDG